MSEFILNERLAKGGFDFGELHGCKVLLKNNAHFTWFILVPMVAVEEIHELSALEYENVNKATLKLAQFLKSHVSHDKINVGNIGNVVRQMHVHVVARKSDDPAWPGVVWACKEKTSYENDEVTRLKGLWAEFLV